MFRTSTGTAKEDAVYQIECLLLQTIPGLEVRVHTGQTGLIVVEVYSGGRLLAHGSHGTVAGAIDLVFGASAVRNLLRAGRQQPKEQS